MATANPPIAEVFEVSSSAVFSHDLQQTLYTYQQQAHLTDFTIHVQTTQIHCHRVILSAASPYFEAMVRSGMQEVGNSQVNLDCLDKDIVYLLIKYFYTGELKTVFSKICDLVAACEFLQLWQLKAQIEEHLLTTVGDSNCIGWFKISKIYAMDKLAQVTTDIMLNHFTSVCRKREFLKLSLAELLDYLRKKKMLIHSEDAILDACVTWINRDKEARKASFKDVLANVTLTNCSAKHLAKVYEENKVLFDNSGFQETLSDTFRRLAVSYEQPVFETEDSDKMCLLLCGGDIDPDKANNSIYICVDGKWNCISTLPIDCTSIYTSICLLKGRIIVTGGEKTCRSAVLYNLNTRAWNELPQLPSSRYAHSSYNVGNRLYVLGGYVTNGLMNMSVDVLNTSTWTWGRGNDLLHGVYLPITVKKDKNIYIIQNSDSANKDTIQKHGITLQIYDAESYTCRFRAPLTNVVSNTRGACAVVYKNDILLLGGEPTISVRYSIELDKWTVLSTKVSPNKDMYFRLSLPGYGNTHLYGAAVVSEGNVLVLGGSQYDINVDKSQGDHVSEFDVETATWKASEITCPLRVKNHLVASIPVCYLMK